MTSKPIRATVALLLSGVVGVASAQLTPASFLQADLEARQTTITNMRERLVLVQSGASVADEMAAVARGEAAVAATFARYGTTPAKHAAYAARHAEEIEALLAADPEWVSRMLSLQTQWRDLSAAFDGARRR